MLRRSLVKPARTQVEQGILFHLSNGGSVRALHVVSIDFQLRLGVNLRVIRKQQVAVGLLGVSLLRVFVDKDAAVENSVTLSIQNAVIELAAGAMRSSML